MSGDFEKKIQSLERSNDLMEGMLEGHRERETAYKKKIALLEKELDMVKTEIVSLCDVIDQDLELKKAREEIVRLKSDTQRWEKNYEHPREWIIDDAYDLVAGPHPGKERIEVVEKSAYLALEKERDEYERLANEWMQDCDKLKEKYEPMVLVESENAELKRQLAEKART